jgi:hypothetical protein
MVCRTTISGALETGQSAVRIDLIEREGEGAARLQLFLPVGLYLQAGVKITMISEQRIEYFRRRSLNKPSTSDPSPDA